jgi:hypothetical protein
MLLVAIALLSTTTRAARAQGGRQRALAAAAPAKPSKEHSSAPLMQAKGPRRIDFDDRQAQGQAKKPGVVHLHQRKAAAQPGLLARRNTFRQEIARDLLE